MKQKITDTEKFNTFNFLSTFARSLIEIFISLYLFKNGFTIHQLVLFYIIENCFSIFLAYIYVLVGEKYNYSIPIFIGVSSFLIVQVLLLNCVNSMWYIILIAFIYSMYRRGYWVSRRFYITNIMPTKESSKPFSIIMIVSQLGSIIAGYVGSMLLDGLNMKVLIAISSVIFFMSIIPLITIKYEKRTNKIKLRDNFKKYDKRNLVAFTMFELSNLLEFLFPIYIATYITNTYTMAGSVNAISNVSIIVFIFIYGKLIKEKNHFVVSMIAFLIINILKLFTMNYIILAICFIEGIIKKMQNQSLNKVYFENRSKLDVTHYNLMYQIIESAFRTLVAIPLLFFNNIIFMLLFVLLIILIELLIYVSMKKNKILS